MGHRDVWLRPLVTWACLLAAVALSAGYALLPGAPAKPAVALAFALGQIAAVLVLLMNLRTASPLIRMTALIAIVWLGFLFLMSFADLTTR